MASKPKPTQLTQSQLLAALRRLLSRTPFISDFRKLSDGRIVRFVDWRNARRG